MRLSDQVKKKLADLPDKPGVYLMRDRHGRIIYIGKAASLRSRVRSYFQRGTLRNAPPKLRGLIRSIHDLDILVLRNEAEAILNEGRLIKEYRPRYNVLMRDDKRFLLLRVDPNEPFPRLRTCRIEKEDGARYFGPYASSSAARAAAAFCEKTFGLRVCRPRNPGPEDYRHCHNDIIRHCSAPCIGRVDSETYRARVEEACAFLRGERPAYLKAIRARMQEAAAAMQFEQAAALRDTLWRLEEAVRRRARMAQPPDVQRGRALEGIREIQRALRLEHEPRRIECYDISNISGTYAVGSLVYAEDGRPNRAHYRRFRIKTISGTDDPGMMAEVIRRRFTRLRDEGAAPPDLIIVDGGLTQLRAARRELDTLGYESLPVAGLAKRFEELHYEAGDVRSPVAFANDSPALMVLKQIRDEAHRFALTYHRHLRRKRIQESILDEIPGIGPRKKQLLLKHFGSLARIRRASEEKLAGVPGIGPRFAHRIYATLHPATPQPEAKS